MEIEEEGRGDPSYRPARGRPAKRTGRCRKCGECIFFIDAAWYHENIRQDLKHAGEPKVKVPA